MSKETQKIMIAGSLLDAQQLEELAKTEDGAQLIADNIIIARAGMAIGTIIYELGLSLSPYQLLKMSEIVLDLCFERETEEILTLMFEQSPEVVSLHKDLNLRRYDC